MVVLAPAQTRVAGTTELVRGLLVITFLMMRRIDFVDDRFRGFPWKFFYAIDRILLFEAKRDSLLH